MKILKLILVFFSLFLFNPIMMVANSKASKLILKSNQSISLEEEYGELQKIWRYDMSENYIKDTSEIINSRLEELALEAIQEKSYLLACDIYNYLGRNNWTWYYNYEKSVDYWLKSRELHRFLSDDGSFQKMMDLKWLAKSYYSFKAYQKSIQYCKEAVVVNENSTIKQSTSDVINTMGLCFEKLNKLDSSFYYYNLALEKNPKDKNTIWEGIVKGNIGYNYYLEKKYDIAIPLMKYCIFWARKEGDIILATGSLTPLADIYLKQGNLELCRASLKESKKYLDQFKQPERYEEYFKVSNRYFVELGDKANANAAMDSFEYYNNISDDQFGLLILMRIQQRKEIENRQKAIAKVESEKKIKTVQRNYLIASLSIVFILFLYFIRLQKKKHLAEQTLKENTIKNKNEVILKAQDQLGEFSKNITEKTALIEQFQDELNEKQEHKNSLLTQIKENTILTETQWTNFQKLFDEVHPGFLYNLKNKYSSLTQAELRYLALTKLNLTNKEMAAMQGISQEAVRVTLYRMRKKLNLKEDEVLSKLISKG